MSPDELSAYRLPQPMLTDLEIKALSTPQSFKELPKNERYSVSMQTLLFAMIEKIDQVVECIIEHFKAENPLGLNARFQSYELAPLHLATILNQEVWVSLLLAAGADPNVQDHRKWTPLHHAALVGNRQIIKTLLLDKRTDSSLLTVTKGSYKDILHLVELPHTDPNEFLPILWENTKGKIRRLTHRQFREKTGAVYLRENYVSRKWLVDEWRSGSKAEKESISSACWEHTEQVFKKKYHQFQLNPPVHRVRKVTRDDNNQVLKHTPGFGLFADRDYEPNEIIGEYLAKIGKHQANDYSLGRDWDASGFGNAMRLINDAYPNVQILTLSNLNHLAERHLITTISKIKKGDQICLDYTSSHRIKISPYIELRPAALRQFIANFDMEKFRSYTVPLPGTKGFLDIVFAKAIQDVQLKYLVHTSGLLFTLVWEGAAKISQLQQIVNYGFSREKKSDGNLEARENQLLLIDYAEIACKIRTLLAKSQALSHFTDLINSWIETKTVKEIFTEARDTIPSLYEALS